MQHRRLTHQRRGRIAVQPIQPIGVGKRRVVSQAPKSPLRVRGTVRPGIGLGDGVEQALGRKPSQPDVGSDPVLIGRLGWVRRWLIICDERASPYRGPRRQRSAQPRAGKRDQPPKPHLRFPIRGAAFMGFPPANDLFSTGHKKPFSPLRGITGGFVPDRGGIVFSGNFQPPRDSNDMIY